MVPGAGEAARLGCEVPTRLLLLSLRQRDELGLPAEVLLGERPQHLVEPAVELLRHLRAMVMMMDARRERDTSRRERTEMREGKEE